jgi:hypothetical protein
LLLESHDVLKTDSEQVPQTANDGKIGHVQLDVSQDTGTSEISAAMMPLYTAAFVESPKDNS